MAPENTMTTFNQPSKAEVQKETKSHYAYPKSTEKPEFAIGSEITQTVRTITEGAYYLPERRKKREMDRRHQRARNRKAKAMRFKLRQYISPAD